MPEYERSITVSAPTKQLFDYLADVSNLPRYFSRMTSAVPAHGDAVTVQAKVPDGSSRKGEAWFRTDADAHRIEWGSETDSDYVGWLQVEAADGDAADGSDQSSTVTVHLQTPRAGDAEDDLRDTLEEIKRLVETGEAPSS